MVTKISKYRTIDGEEFNTHDEAYEHEVSLKIISDVRDAVVDTINTTKDDQNRRVYGITIESAHALADMLVMTDLHRRVSTILKDKV